ncbi:exosome complex exonuclease RRP44A [Pelomyxa schiedti]|nr:exosome complex exonuclease RRP44A [Pelomyxa schiedti]
MRGNTVFFKKTRQGKVVQVSREKYLRNDLPCGYVGCPACSSMYPNSSSGLGMVMGQSSFDSPIATATSLIDKAPTLATAFPPGTKPCIEGKKVFVVDTNVVLLQMDLLENHAITNFVIVSTVINEVSHQNRGVYRRLSSLINEQPPRFFLFSNENHRETSVNRLPGESANDRNDRAIRVVCKWYQQHLGPSVEVVLVSNDRGNVNKALAEGLKATTIHSFVHQYHPDRPDLVDILVSPSSEQPMDDDADNANAESASASAKKKLPSYTEYLAMPELKRGIQERRFFQGPLRVSQNNFLEAFLPMQGSSEDIQINGWESINRAVSGDIVVVKLLPKDKWLKIPCSSLDNPKAKGAKKPGTETHRIQPTGCVVGVVKRSWKPYTGSLEIPKKATSSNDGKIANLLFIATDTRIPPISIQTRNAASLMGKRIVVAIDRWGIRSKYPCGHFVRDLGVIGDKETESNALLIQHDIPFHPFSDSVLACLPALPWEFKEEMLTPGRMDLRDRLICSVDPPGCKDIDDALHAKPLPDGTYEVGVHIADVSHYVLEGTALDMEARDRGTTVYLADRRIDMLPKPLTEDICSLRENQTRMAFSVIWKMTKNAEIQSIHITKSIIKSRHAFSYGEAQMWIDDEQRQDDLTKSLRVLLELGKHLKQKRIEAGALLLASSEIHFTKDANYQPVDIELYQLKDTNSMVEEFMLLANVEVAKYTYKHFPHYALLRRHPTPNPKNFTWLQDLLRKRDFDINPETAKTLGQSLEAAVDPEDPNINHIIRMLTTRCMTQAVYFSSGTQNESEFHHFGLAAEIYTHFTSPIRRYADLLVHRLLASSIGHITVSTNYSKSIVQSICVKLNHRHMMAQYAARVSNELHSIIFFKGKSIIEMAYVSRLKAGGFICFVPRFGIESLVYVTAATQIGSDGETKKIKKNKAEIETPTEPFEYSETDQHLRSLSGKTCIAVLDKVVVHIDVDSSSPHGDKLRMLCIIPPVHQAPSQAAAQRANALAPQTTCKTTIPLEPSAAATPASAATSASASTSTPAQADSEGKPLAYTLVDDGCRTSGAATSHESTISSEVKGAISTLTTSEEAESDVDSEELLGIPTNESSTSTSTTPTPTTAATDPEDEDSGAADHNKPVAPHKRPPPPPQQIVTSTTPAPTPATAPTTTTTTITFKAPKGSKRRRQAKEDD